MRILNRIFFVTSLCLLIAIPFVGIWFGARDYQGYCLGIGDPVACTQWQFVQFQTFFSFAAIVPWLGWVLGVWLLLNLGNRAIDNFDAMKKG